MLVVFFFFTRSGSHRSGTGARLEGRNNDGVELVRG